MKRENTVSRDSIAGVWKRVVLVDGTGAEDRESDVYWIQASRLFADIRRHRRLTALVAGLTEEDLPFVDAFTGRLRQARDMFHWDAALRSREHQGPPDEGRLTWAGADLHEYGVHMEYFEQWTRVAEATADSFAVLLEDADHTRSAYVLSIGPYVFYGRVGLADRHANGGADVEFSLFEASPEGCRVVLTTADPRHTTCPVVEFSDVAQREAWISWPYAAGAKRREQWLVAALEDCGTPNAQATISPKGDEMR